MSTHSFQARIAKLESDIASNEAKRERVSGIAKEFELSSQRASAPNRQSQVINRQLQRTNAEKRLAKFAGKDLEAFLGGSALSDVDFGVAAKAGLGNLDTFKIDATKEIERLRADQQSLAEAVAFKPPAVGDVAESRVQQERAEDNELSQRIASAQARANDASLTDFERTKAASELALAQQESGFTDNKRASRVRLGRKALTQEVANRRELKLGRRNI